MESKLDISIVGNYSIKQAKPEQNCKICCQVDFADVLINGICGRCLLAFWGNYYEKEKCSKCNQVDINQTGEHPCSECGLPVVHDERPNEPIKKKVKCLNCDWHGTEKDLVSKVPYLKECDYIYCPKCESDNIYEYYQETI